MRSSRALFRLAQAYMRSISMKCRQVSTPRTVTLSVNINSCM